MAVELLTRQFMKPVERENGMGEKKTKLFCVLSQNCLLRCSLPSHDVGGIIPTLQKKKKLSTGFSFK